MSGKGKLKGGTKDAAAPPAPATEDPLEDAVEEELEHSYARRMLETDPPPGESVKREKAGKKPAPKKPGKKKPSH
jgi:hypothetical protein